MNSLLLDSRAECEPSLASQIHDCTRELMEATNVIEAKAKESVDQIKSAAEARCAQVDAAKKAAEEKRKKQVAEGEAKIKGEGAALQAKSSELKDLRCASETVREDLHQSDRLKTELAERVVDLAASRDLEKRICGQKKAVVEDYFDAVEKQVAQYQSLLGLSMSRDSNGHLEFTFNRVDPRSPSRSFSLALHLHPISKLYSFVSSSPQVDFQPLVDALNRTNNLKRFLCRSRKAFIATLKH